LALTKAKKAFFGGMSLLGATLLVQLSCHVYLWLSLDRIGDVHQSPETYAKRVYVGGRIENTLCLPFIGSIYRLRDSSGAVWVMTKDDSVVTGKYAVVSGYVKSEFSLDDAGKWRPALELLDETELVDELSEPKVVVIEKGRKGILRSAVTNLWH